MNTDFFTADFTDNADGEKRKRQCTQAEVKYPSFRGFGWQAAFKKCCSNCATFSDSTAKAGQRLTGATGLAHYLLTVSKRVAEY